MSKKMILATASFVALSLLVSACMGNLPGISSMEKGSLVVSFDLSKTLASRSIKEDFSLAASGEVFLKQGGVTKKQAAMAIDSVAMTGSCAMSDIALGSYDIVLELYDSGARVIYDAANTVTIAAGTNAPKQMSLEKYVGSLSLSGSWTEDIAGLAAATAELRQSGATKYGSSLSLASVTKTVSGSFNGVYPGSYDLYVAVRDGTGLLEFEGTKSLTIAKGANATSLGLVCKTGSISILVGGDATAPVITAGPAATGGGTITWTTNEMATSTVCYSSTSGFDYKSSLCWAPLGGDLSADATSHSVVISGLTSGQTYYYVAVSTDASGNTVVSDEKSLLYSGSSDWSWSTGFESGTIAIEAPLGTSYDLPSISTTAAYSGTKSAYFLSNGDNGNASPSLLLTLPAGSGRQRIEFTFHMRYESLTASMSGINWGFSDARPVDGLDSASRDIRLWSTTSSYYMGSLGSPQSTVSHSSPIGAWVEQKVVITPGRLEWYEDGVLRVSDTAYPLGNDEIKYIWLNGYAIPGSAVAAYLDDISCAIQY